jgi:glyoxylase-like metal-dependent hydrolase (beta-lactamase superfamily II)
MRERRRLDRRSWLVRSAGGLVAVWSALDFGWGRRGWGVLVGGGPPRGVSAQEAEAPRVLSASVDFEFQGRPLNVAAYALVRGEEVAVVDTLLRGNAGKIEAVLQDAGLGWGSVKHVILTHFHGDHVGNLSDVLDLASEAAVYAGAPDIPRIESARAITPVDDGQEVFGLQIVATPGHTPGHISVYDPVGSALITGDAAANVGGTLDRHWSLMDEAMANESLKKLAALTFERALFGHGDPIEGGGSAAFRRLADGLP